jgi:L,D-peptidoglycan transpeptidase YkuD (ErfK/YbiS/YcfS/YnhG family)
MITIQVDTHNPTQALLHCNNKHYPCVIGRAGAVEAVHKREGDGATPKGSYHILRGFYRADRLMHIPTTKGLEMLPITADMGWQDDPQSPHYNQWVASAYPQGKPESFWRDDSRYNIILVIDHNGAWPFLGYPPKNLSAKQNGGSAIFIHVWNLGEGEKPTPTAGCVALHQQDILEILSSLTAEHPLIIQ